jgi:DNA-binding MarR family transcriptional regulator
MNGRLSTHDLSSVLRVAVARLSRRLRAEKEDDELSDSQTSILAYLVREGSGTIGRLSEHERVKPPSMNRTVNHLERAGYVERTSDEADGRKVVVVPTERGVDLVAETRRRRDAWLNQRLRTLTPEQRATLAQAAEIMRGLADS